MTPPAFWFTAPEAPAWRARLLSPFGRVYGWMAARRLTQMQEWRAPVPVIGVDCLSVGTTGVTATARALALHLQARGRVPGFLFRAPGARSAAPMAVDPRNHTATDVGDEALLSAAFAPAWTAEDATLGVRAILETSPTDEKSIDCILIDGAFGNPRPVKDLSVIVADAVLGFGNGQCIPAGPLRWPLAQGLARADLLVSIGPPAAQQAFLHTWQDRLPARTIRARMEPLQTGMNWRGARVLAFAGIDLPERFFATLADLGADLRRAEALDAHQPLTPVLMTRLEREAQILGAQLVTTEQDAVRLPPAFRYKVLTLPIRLKIADPAPLNAELDRIGL